ncbi:MAG: S41 family peptidase [Oscillospiraceae bacterium]|nr:S41 family peptidase [Oscillospiraceae bacterium]
MLKTKRLLARLIACLLAIWLLLAPVLALPESGEERLALLEEILELIDTYALYPPDELSLEGLTAELLLDDDLFISTVAAWQAADPYGYFMPQEEYDEVFGLGGGAVYGIGVQMDVDMPLGVYAKDFIEGSGADRSGMEIGAQIVTVDGVFVADMHHSEVRPLLIGDLFTSVTIGYINPGSDQVHYERIQRGMLNIPNVKGHLIDGTDVGYISIEQFGSMADFFDFDHYYNTYLPGMEARSVIIDLRGNRGGQLYTVLNILNVMIPNEGLLLCRLLDAEGEVEFFSTGWDLEEMAQWGGMIWEPDRIVVLTDGRSASASEIFAGTLQAHGLAVTVGETTYGKAHSQIHATLSSGYMLILTADRIELHEIGSYDQTGIRPDHEVKTLAVFGSSLVEAQLDTSRALFRQSNLTPRITAMQERLALLGFYRCEPSGVFDGYTIWCLNRFQTAAGLEQGRFANTATLEALEEAVAEAVFIVDLQLELALALCGWELED